MSRIMNLASIAKLDNILAWFAHCWMPRESRIRHKQLCLLPA
jgi:hypothetical protein